MTWSRLFFLCSAPKYLSPSTAKAPGSGTSPWSSSTRPVGSHRGPAPPSRSTPSSTRRRAVVPTTAQGAPPWPPSPLQGTLPTEESSSGQSRLPSPPPSGGTPPLSSSHCLPTGSVGAVSAPASFEGRLGAARGHETRCEPFLGRTNAKHAWSPRQLWMARSCIGPCASRTSAHGTAPPKSTDWLAPPSCTARPCTSPMLPSRPRPEVRKTVPLALHARPRTF
mmetsp:Transcript_5664/g.16405  ORF Transcript_5664/g.16405 Transcript_5664/m.16405 type:complete len:223 (+) Transcript_5664:318-986(+)